LEIVNRPAGARGAAGGQEFGQGVERARHQPVVGPFTALLAGEQAGLDEDFHVVRHRWLGQPHRPGEIADARLTVGLGGDE
jgi:hypothetical protein